MGGTGVGRWWWYRGGYGYTGGYGYWSRLALYAYWSRSGSVLALG